MLNNVFVPNKYTCPNDSRQEPNWDEIPECVDNFYYDDLLITEVEQLNQLRAPYYQLDTIVLPEDLKLHQYFVTTSEIQYPISSEADVTIPPNSRVLRYTVTDDPYRDYVVLSQSQTFFNYTPTATSYSFTWSPYDPEKDKCYIRPVGEWAHAPSRIYMNSNTKVLNNNTIVYYFSSANGYALAAPAWFTTDYVCAKLYLSEESQESIACVPASIGHEIIQGTPNITLNLHTTNLPSSFYVEVF